MFAALELDSSSGGGGGYCDSPRACQRRVLSRLLGSSLAGPSGVRAPPSFTCKRPKRYITHAQAAAAAATVATPNAFHVIWKFFTL
jgi:hypothetical protein